MRQHDLDSHDTCRHCGEWAPLWVECPSVPQDGPYAGRPPIGDPSYDKWMVGRFFELLEADVAAAEKLKAELSGVTDVMRGVSLAEIPDAEFFPVRSVAFTASGPCPCDACKPGRASWDVDYSDALARVRLAPK